MSELHKRLTWADVRSWAEANDVPDDAEMKYLTADGGLRAVRDLDQHEGEDGLPPEFVLQEMWG